MWFFFLNVSEVASVWCGIHRLYSITNLIMNVPVCHHIFMLVMLVCLWVWSGLVWSVVAR